MVRLILFDIDRTLLHHCRAHAEAFTFAMKKTFGVEGKTTDIDPYGLTDAQILVDVLKSHGLSEEDILPKLKACVKSMEDYFKRADVKVYPMPGAPELLERLDAEGYAIGLVTGNLESIAQRKMEKLGLWHFIRVGGYGSDDRIRSKLVPIALERANRNGLAVSEAILVGDTPRDVKAGLDNSVKVIAVATGVYSEEQLREAGAKNVLRDLTDTDAFLKLL